MGQRRLPKLAGAGYERGEAEAGTSCLPAVTQQPWKASLAVPQPLGGLGMGRSSAARFRVVSQVAFIIF